MKRLLMLFLLALTFVSYQPVFAYDYGSLPQDLPYVRGDITYDNVIVGVDATYHLPFACYISVGHSVSYTKSYAGGYLCPSTSLGGGGTTYCFIKENGTSWTGGYSGGIGVLDKTTGSCPVLSTTVDIYYIGANYNYGTNYCNMGAVSTNQKIFSKDIFDYDPPTLDFPLSGSLENRTILLEFGETWTFGECPTGTYKKHAGLDLDATADEEVYAAHDGTIKAIFTGNHAQWADAIIIEDDNQQYTTVYWHVIKYDDLAVNDYVTKGEQIATVADLGGNTHFHFGFRSSSYDSSFSLAGALPEEACGTSPTYPAFPEYFLDPAQLTYE